MTTALLMAGGRGERMRATGAPTPKPLVTIRGVPLLERNLMTLLYSGFRDIVVAVPSHTPEIARFVSTRGRKLTEVFGARLRLLEESQPLGNIGAVAEVETRDADVLVVYADNLTSLDLNALVSHHCQAQATLTSAVHLELFKIPFGEVQVRDGSIIGYLEKSERRIPISSGLYVLSSAAVAHVPRGERTEVSWLANRLLAAGEKVAAFTHDAPWIDVNDSVSVGRAERLVADHAEAFECRAAPPDGTVVSALMHHSSLLLLEQRPPDSSRYPDTWDLPGRILEPGQVAETVLEQELQGILGLTVMMRGSPCLFDDLDPASRQVYRHIVFPVELGDSPLSAPPGRVLRSMPWPGVTETGLLSPVVVRALAAYPGTASTC